jgi:hypothetical protein
MDLLGYHDLDQPKLPYLHRLAPTGTEPSFILAQGVLLVAFVWLGIRAARHFRSVNLPGVTYSAIR